MCDLYADEVCEVWNRSTPRARKEYRCECCSRQIAVGEKYVRTFTVFEGEADTSKHCAPCDRELTRFGKAHSFYPAPETLTEYLEECVREADDAAAAAPWKRSLKRIAARRAA